jgi:hypothetical protein
MICNFHFLAKVLVMLNLGSYLAMVEAEDRFDSYQCIEKNKVNLHVNEAGYNSYIIYTPIYNI